MYAITDQEQLCLERNATLLAQHSAAQLAQYVRDAAEVFFLKPSSRFADALELFATKPQSALTAASPPLVEVIRSYAAASIPDGALTGERSSFVCYPAPVALSHFSHQIAEDVSRLVTFLDLIPESSLRSWHLISFGAGYFRARLAVAAIIGTALQAVVWRQFRIVVPLSSLRRWFRSTHNGSASSSGRGLRNILPHWYWAKELLYTKLRQRQEHSFFIDSASGEFVCPFSDGVAKFCIGMWMSGLDAVVQSGDLSCDSEAALIMGTWVAAHPVRRAIQQSFLEAVRMPTPCVNPDYSPIGDMPQLMIPPEWWISLQHDAVARVEEMYAFIRRNALTDLKEIAAAHSARAEEVAIISLIEACRRSLMWGGSAVLLSDSSPHRVLVAEFLVRLKMNILPAVILEQFQWRDSLEHFMFLCIQHLWTYSGPTNCSNASDRVQSVEQLPKQLADAVPVRRTRPKMGVCDICGKRFSLKMEALHARTHQTHIRKRARENGAPSLMHDLVMVAEVSEKKTFQLIMNATDSICSMPRGNELWSDLQGAEIVVDEQQGSIMSLMRLQLMLESAHGASESSTAIREQHNTTIVTAEAFVDHWTSISLETTCGGNELEVLVDAVICSEDDYNDREKAFGIIL